MLLPTIQSRHHMYGLLELDIAPTLANHLGLDLSLPENLQSTQTVLSKMGQVASRHLTGLVIDPIYSFSVSQHSKQAGFLTRLNILTDEVDPLAVPILIPDYGLEEIANNYNLAKFELYYHPLEENSLKKKQLLAEIHDYCDYLDMNLLLKLQLYDFEGNGALEANFQEQQLVAAQELARTTDLIALQNPVEPLSIATLTAELDIPWILLHQQQDYEQFKQDLRLCLENGASGFLTGQALWRELVEFKQDDQSPNLEKIEQFIETTFQDRLIELMRIVDEYGEKR